MKASERLKRKLSYKGKITDWLILTLIIIAIYSSTGFWLRLDSSLPHWDMGRHLLTIYSYRDLWSGFFHGTKSIFGLISWYQYYPPLVHTVALLFSLAFGFSQDTAVMSNILWISILVFSVYNIGTLYWNRLIAFCAVLFVCASPMLIGQFREFQVDMPLTAMVALGLLYLFKTDHFRNRRDSILFGLFVGLGMLTKWTYAAFLGPAVLYLLLEVTSKKIWSKKVLLNIAFAGIAAFIVAGGWYVRNLTALRADFQANGIQAGISEGDPVGFTKEAFAWYPERFTSNYLLLPLLILVICSIFFMIVKKEARKNFIFFFLIIIWCLIFSSMPNKDIRYLMPAIIPCAILGSSIINFISRNWAKYVIASILVLAFLVNNTLVVFSAYLPKINFNFYLDKNQRFPLLAYSGYTSSSPKEEFCPMEKIINSIPEKASARIVGDSRIEFSDWAVAYYLVQNNRKWSGQAENWTVSPYIIYHNYPGNRLSESDVINSGILINEFGCLDGSKVMVLKTNAPVVP